MQVFHDQLFSAVHSENSYMEGLECLTEARLDQMDVLSDSFSWYDWPAKTS